MGNKEGDVWVSADENLASFQGKAEKDIELAIDAQTEASGRSQDRGLTGQEQGKHPLQTSATHRCSSSILHEQDPQNTTGIQPRMDTSYSGRSEGVCESVQQPKKTEVRDVESPRSPKAENATKVTPTCIPWEARQTKPADPRLLVVYYIPRDEAEEYPIKANSAQAQTNEGRGMITTGMSTQGSHCRIPEGQPPENIGEGDGKLQGASVREHENKASTSSGLSHALPVDSHCGGDPTGIPPPSDCLASAMKPHDNDPVGLSSGDGHSRGHGHEKAGFPESSSGSPAPRTQSDTQREGSPPGSTPKSSDEDALFMEKMKAFREAVIKVLEQSGRPITYPTLRVGLKKHGLSTLRLKIPVKAAFDKGYMHGVLAMTRMSKQGVPCMLFALEHWGPDTYAAILGDQTCSADKAQGDKADRAPEGHKPSERGQQENQVLEPSSRDSTGSRRSRHDKKVEARGRDKSPRRDGHEGHDGRSRTSRAAPVGRSDGSNFDWREHERSRRRSPTRYACYSRRERSKSRTRSRSRGHRSVHRNRGRSPSTSSTSTDDSSPRRYRRRRPLSRRHPNRGESDDERDDRCRRRRSLSRVDLRRRCSPSPVRKRSSARTSPPRVGQKREPPKYSNSKHAVAEQSCAKKRAIPDSGTDSDASSGTKPRGPDDRRDDSKAPFEGPKPSPKEFNAKVAKVSARVARFAEEITQKTMVGKQTTPCATGDVKTTAATKEATGKIQAPKVQEVGSADEKKYAPSVPEQAKEDSRPILANPDTASAQEPKACETSPEKGIGRE